jgi:hypothetical protein
VVDEFTDMKWSVLKNKLDLQKAMLQFLSKLQDEQVKVKFIRMNNNNDFQHKVQSSPFTHIEFELTAPGTPQQNGIVERAFATLLGHAKAMWNQAGLLAT